MCQGHGCHDVGSPQRGIPMTDEVISAMSVEEQAFWVDFLGEAKGLVEGARARGEERPLTPTDSLRRKYRKALTEYDGEGFCQMRQIKEIFGF